MERPYLTLLLCSCLVSVVISIMLLYTMMLLYTSKRYSYDTEVLLMLNAVIDASHVESNFTNLEAKILSYSFSNHFLM